MGRAILEPTCRLLNHTEMFYAPGDRAAARALFRAIGCRVLDPQEEDGPADLGPAAGPYLIVFVDPDSPDLIDNVMYCSEVEPAQWQLEQALRERIASDATLQARYEAFEDCFARYPQGMTHFGVAMTEEGLARAFERLERAPELAGRIRLSGPFRPGEPGSVDARVIQGFVRTDVVSTGLLLGGQQIELQVRLD
jgi:hypothetical protein